MAPRTLVLRQRYMCVRETGSSSYVTLEKLRGLYETFDDGERRMADQVLIEWALSEDEELRFDGLALIDELKIATAVSALYELATRLASSTEVSAPYELEKVHRIIAGFGFLGRAR